MDRDVSGGSDTWHAMEAASLSETGIKNTYKIIIKKVPTFYFIGVTTGQSSIMKVFPRWMEALGEPTTIIEGIDHKLHDVHEKYRQTVAQIKYDPLSIGALITSHKIDVLEAAEDMFDILDISSRLTGEISCISKHDGQLIGHALDPLTGGMSLDAILGREYFARTGGYVLCFGAGGAGKAVALHLIQKDRPGDQPKRMIVVNRSQPRLTKLRRMVDDLGTDINFEYIRNENPTRNDEIMINLPDGSIVINATGLGKDRPGSPITDKGLFPIHGIAWEMNYRGALDFWHQAKAQEYSQNVTVEDGWLYFLHGWSQHISEVLHTDMDNSTFIELSEIAEELRPPLQYKPRRYPHP